MRSFGPTARLELAVGHHLDGGRHFHVDQPPRAHTPAMSVAPTPMAMAPMAPWLLVWLSAPTTTMPGRT